MWHSGKSGRLCSLVELMGFLACAVERRAFLAGANPCAVERRTFLAGANPARQLSLQPVASRAGHGGNEMA